MNNVMKRWNNPKYDQQKRQYKINETYQQACFLWLLNQFCEIELEPRKHPTKRIASNPIIKTLNFNDDIIELSQLADQRCKELIKESQYPNKSNELWKAEWQQCLHPPVKLQTSLRYLISVKRETILLHLQLFTEVHITCLVLP